MLHALLPSALVEAASGQFHAPGLLPTKNSPEHPVDRRLGGSMTRSERCKEVKIFCPNQKSNLDSSVPQWSSLQSSHYTDRAIPAYRKTILSNINTPFTTEGLIQCFLTRGLRGTRGNSEGFVNAKMKIPKICFPFLFAQSYYDVDSFAYRRFLPNSQLR